MKNNFKLLFTALFAIFCSSLYSQDECDPYLVCGQALTCIDGLLYPTTCGPDNCDEPISECDDGENELNCFDLNYYECGLTLDCVWNFNSGCSPNDNDHDEEEDQWTCSDIQNQEECEYVGCDWTFSNNMPGGGACSGNIEDDDHEGDDDGPPDCLSDCEGIESIDPEGNPYQACDWIVSYLGFDPGFASCTSDCDDEIMMEISQVVDACYSCLGDEAFDCADVFGDNDEEDWECSSLTQDECTEAENCEPNFSANGSFESCDTSIHEDEECDPYLICGEAITCIDGLLYPTTCGPDNCDEPIGECDDGGGNSDGPPECLLDCEGIENINPDEDPYRACELIIELSQTNCIEDCAEEEMAVIDYVVEGCQECLENEDYDCYQVFNDDQCDCDSSEDCDQDCECDSDCYDENCFSDCEGVEGINPSEDADGFCMWILDLDEECIADCQDVEGLYFICSACLEDPSIDCSSIFQDCDCDESEDCDENCDCDNDCEDDGIDECLYDCEELFDISDQDPNGICEAFLSIDGSECTEDCSADAIAELSFINLLCEQCLYNNSCDDLFGGEEEEYGRLRGTVQYVFGDYIDFIPQAEVLIVGENDNPSQAPFEEIVFTDEYGYYEINLPVGMYYVTAYAFNEELTQEIYIDSGEEYNLDFILGDFGGGWDGLLGDINSDFEINVLDVVLLVNFVLGIDEPNEYQFMLSDMNSDGAIDILDVVQVINIILDR